MSHLAFPDQLSIRLGTEGHNLPIRNRHFDDEVQKLVLVLLVLRPLAVIISDDPLTLPAGVTTRNFSLQEVHSRLHLRKELQLKVSNTEVPPSIRSDNTPLKKTTSIVILELIIIIRGQMSSVPMLTKAIFI